MLHIFNGQSTEATFIQTKLPGESISWKEGFITGASPSQLSEDEWIQTRSEHLTKTYGVSLEDCKSELLEQANQLKAASNHDEVILWFGFDLSCQLNLLNILSFFSQQKKLATKLSLICINEFPGIEPFYGLGQLYPEHLVSLFDTRKAVTKEMLTLGRDAWNAFSASNPEEIVEFLKKDISALPFLKEPLSAHLSRFPSSRNGLGFLQNKILDLLASGIDEFKPLFPLFREFNPIFGLGELQLWHFIQELSNSGNPLIEVFNLDTTEHPAISESFKQTYFKLTTTGKAILVGNRDMLNVNDIDYWLGGVHVSHDNPIWRWDEENMKLYLED